jgi:hypothetical protein
MICWRHNRQRIRQIYIFGGKVKCLPYAVLTLTTSPAFRLPNNSALTRSDTGQVKQLLVASGIFYAKQGNNSNRRLCILA